MKVLMLGWELPPHNSGGLGVACFQLCKALAHSGADIDFILPYEAEHDAPFMNVKAALSIDVAALRSLGMAYDSFRYQFKELSSGDIDLFALQSKYEEATSNIAAESSYEVIHAHDWLTFRAGIIAKNIINRPLIVHVHSVESDRAGGAPGNPYVREIEELGLLRADSIIAVSAHTKKAIMRDYGIPSEKITVIHNSIDHDIFLPTNELETENVYSYLSELKQRGWKVVVNVGRLTVQKGLTNLLHAAQEVIKRNPKTMFLFVGNGEQFEELLLLGAELGIASNILFAGFQRGKRWRDAYRIADLFVMPSVSEPFGLAPLEAIGHGAPVLVSKQSGVSEVLKSCLKVDFWDTDKLADSITSVVQNNALSEELYTNAAHELRSLSWYKQAPHFLQLYTSLQQGKGTV